MARGEGVPRFTPKQREAAMTDAEAQQQCTRGPPPPADARAADARGDRMAPPA